MHSQHFWLQRSLCFFFPFGLSFFSVSRTCSPSISYYIVVLVFFLLCVFFFSSVCLFLCLSVSLSHWLFVCMSFLSVCPFSWLSFVIFFSVDGKLNFPKFRNITISSCFTPLNRAWPWQMSDLVETNFSNSLFRIDFLNYTFRNSHYNEV